MNRHMLSLCALAAAGLAFHAPAQTAATPAEEEDVVLIDDAEANTPAAVGLADIAPAPVTPVVAADPKTAVIESSVTAELPKDLASAQDGGRVTLAFEDATVGDIIRAFRDATDANIISGTSTNLQQRLSVRLERVPWRQGLASVLDSCGLRLHESMAGSDIYTVAVKETVQPLITRTFPLTHASSVEIADVFNRSYGKKDAPVATPFPAANVVVVKAPEATIAECDRIIRMVDKPVPQVYIEARFARLSAGASKQLGIKWDSLASGWTTTMGPVSAGMSRTKGAYATTPFAAGEPTEIMGDYGNTHFRGITGSLTMSEFALTMQAIEQTDGASIFSNPKIIVANEREALVDMTQKEPCIEVTTSRTGDNNNQLDISTKLAVIPGKEGERAEPWVGQSYFSYGITLNVIPRVSPDGLITVDIVPTVSTKTGESTLRGEGITSAVYATYPIVKTQRLTTRFTMKDGTTAVIGGLSESREENVDSGIPLLCDIPWVGPRIFGWKERVKSQDEIVIFVTVGVANPHNLPADIGMPKNAVLAKEVQAGTRPEPGDSDSEALLRLKD